MNPDFTSLTKAELRAYVVAHPDDQRAFHAFVDRFTADASPETFSFSNSKAEFEAVEALIRQKIEQRKAG